jgi:hypothetical protein
MYAQGNYFQISALKCKAKEYFKESFMTEYVQDPFMSAVIEVYSSTTENDSGLRDLVLQLTTAHLPLLRGAADSILDGYLLDRVPGFMCDICLSLVERCAQLQRDSGDWGFTMQLHFENSDVLVGESA